MPFEISFSLYAVTAGILAILIAVFVYLVVYYGRQHFYTTRVITPRTMDWVFLEIQMPKENADESTNAKSEEEKKNLVAVAEQLFTTLSHTEGRKGFWGTKDYISFEIASTNKKISFYINCSRSMQQLVEKQIQAQFQKATLKRSKDTTPSTKMAILRSKNSSQTSSMFIRSGHTRTWKLIRLTV